MMSACTFKVILNSETKTKRDIVEAVVYNQPNGARGEWYITVDDGIVVWNLFREARTWIPGSTCLALSLPLEHPPPPRHAVHSNPGEPSTWPFLNLAFSAHYSPIYSPLVSTFNTRLLSSPSRGQEPFIGHPEAGGTWYLETSNRISLPPEYQYKL